MIGRLLRGCVSLLVYACVATVISEAILLLYFGRQWHLNRESVTEILAIAYGIDLFGVKEDAEKQLDQISPEQPSYEQILETRAAKFRNLELREHALQSGLSQLHFEHTKLAEEEKQYKQVQDGLAAQLRTLREDATSTGSQEVRRILESLKPKQAKELITQMLDDKKVEQVVALLAVMPDNKRSKIIGEFKTPQEAEKIGDVLRRIREGTATADVADQTQRKLQELKPNSGM